MNINLAGSREYWTLFGRLAVFNTPPIDVCGKNAELVLQSRIKGFTKEMLAELLYDDRSLVDYPDKNLAIIPVEDWPYFERYRKAARQHAERYLEMEGLTTHVRDHIQNHGALSSNDLKLNGDFSWQSAIHWSGGNNTSRSVLEQMYSTGELIIHHKKGTRKYYDIAKKYIQQHLLNAPDPLDDDFEHHKWRILQRIGFVGLLWNRASDAWLNIWGLKAAQRNEVFRQLLHEARIVAIVVDQTKDKLYCLTEDLPLIEAVLQNPEPKLRCELIAPLIISCGIENLSANCLTSITHGRFTRLQSNENSAITYCLYYMEGTSLDEPR